MKIAFDVHGVIADRPDLFKPLLKLFKSNNIEVIILSGPPKDVIIKELAELGYTDEHYDETLSVADYLKTTGCKMWIDDKNTWWADDESWWSAKGKICEMYDIDVLFDDSEQYKIGMPAETLFVLFEDKKNKNKLTEKTKW